MFQVKKCSINVLMICHCSNNRWKLAEDFHWTARIDNFFSGFVHVHGLRMSILQGNQRGYRIVVNSFYNIYVYTEYFHFLILFQKKPELMEPFLLVKVMWLLAHLVIFGYNTFHENIEVQAGTIASLAWSIYMECCLSALHEKIENHTKEENLQSSESTVSLV